MTSRRLALVVGSGNVGLGVMLPRLQAVGYDVAVVARRAEAADRLQRAGARVRRIGTDERPRVLRPARVVAASAGSEVERLVSAADLVVLALRPHQLDTAAGILVAGLERRRRPVDVLVCDNGAAAGERVAAAVGGLDFRNATARHGYVSVLVDQIATSAQAADGEPVVNVESRGRLFLDARRLRTAPVRLPDAVLVEDHAAYVRRKLFTFSCGHAAVSVLGRLRGHERMVDAVADPHVAAIATVAMTEARNGLEIVHGARFAGPHETVTASLRRFADPDLDDRVDRVLRDLGRKLRADERLSGPAALSLATGGSAAGLAVVAAAALRLLDAAVPRQPREPSAVGGETGDLSRRARATAARRMAILSGLPEDHAFVRLTATAYLALGHDGVPGAAARLVASRPGAAGTFPAERTS